MSFFNESAAPSPMMLPRAQIGKDDEPSAVRINVSEDNTTVLSGHNTQISINPSPSFDTVRACYQYFVARQRKHGRSQYIPTFSEEARGERGGRRTVRGVREREDDEQTTEDHETILAYGASMFYEVRASLQ
ncbi:hypothetical protein I307_04967 [Cryptococcus deuterogattii 99/473]|uniref:Uncharacterized protein n=1 Tax=Cryptococcus deuterogattii Ram5 TaxID=1296110 RepID=A0A0D0V0D3_9TREE|nr:hypothetical protein I313_03853 [Cryptococcus deuterogattii Ram5]KIY55780.1 hypothetical protein I307_04967 [Cryptococcus deuterogattii 99/473]